MNPNTYQEATKTTEIYSKAAINFCNEICAEAEFGRSDAETDPTLMLSMMYCTGKLNGKAGEVAEIVFKAFRGGEFTDQDKDKLFYELGDILWYIARIADMCGHRLGDIMLANIEKLQDRKQRGVIHGNGDNR